MVRPVRVIDTGVRDGRCQIAFDQAVIDLHRDGKVPDTVRFLRFEACALVGRHQAIGREVKIDYCRQNGIGLVRRITGGGAIYLDPGQVGWELIVSRRRFPLPTLQDYTKEICEAVAAGLSMTFSIDARFRPRNDIEVEGKKLCGTGGFFDGDTLFYQGTVLLDAPPERIMACLNVPNDKLRKRRLAAAADRLTTLTALSGGKIPDIGTVHSAILSGLKNRFGLDFFTSDPSTEEEAVAEKLHAEEIGTDEFVFSIDDPQAGECCGATLVAPGGTVTAMVRTEGLNDARRIREILLTGDFFVTPPRIVLDLEAALRGAEVNALSSEVDRFFASAKAELLSLTPAEFKAVINAAVRVTNA